MNPKVQDFLDKKKAEEREKELERRNEHLISLGLIDENKIGKKYGSAFEDNARKEKETGLFYVERYGALEVTDEEYAEICKYSPETTNSNSQKINNSYKEPEQIKYDTPNIQENNGTILQLKEDVSSIKSWVKFWSILSIICAVIAVIVLIANQ